MDRTVSQLLSAVRDLAPTIKARAGESEAERRMPLDLVEELRRAGVFRMCTPYAYGGLEIAFPDLLTVLNILSAADGSAGWVAMIGSVTPIILSRMSRAAFDQVYGSGPDVVVGGALSPGGRGERVDGGWRVSGRWPFASGCQHSDWLVCSFPLPEGETPVGGRPGKMFILPKDAWQIEDTWTVVGLKGTGSHHVKLEGGFVPDELAFDFTGGGPATIPDPMYQAPMPFVSYVHGIVSLGIAEGALADLIELAGAGRQRLFQRTSLRDSEMVQFELGRVEAALRAARTLLYADADDLWQRALAGNASDNAIWIRAYQTTLWVHATCTTAVEQCFALAGGSAIYASSPIQRRVRDILTAGQHHAMNQRRFAFAGAILLGHEAVNPMFG